MKMYLLTLLALFAAGNVVSQGSGIGPQPVSSTSLALGTKFASPGGSGTSCTASQPCDLRTALEGAQAGDIVFLRGGTYNLTRHLSLDNSGQASNPITIESYPGETANISGADHTPGTDIKFIVTGNYYVLRNIEISYHPLSGLAIVGSNNLFVGVHSHHNRLTGIKIYGGSNNIIRNSTVNDNSDAGLTVSPFNDGGNADGISIASGDSNRVENCLAYHNSDDGIDTWQSTNSYVGYCVSADNGIASGNGNGFKLGGTPPSANTLIEHSIAYNNLRNGMDANGGLNVIMRFNTSWSNGGHGFFAYPSTQTLSNISAGDGYVTDNSGTYQNNSWQRSGTPVFISTDSGSSDFLRPVSGGGFTDIGAYGGLGTSVETAVPASFRNGRGTCTIYNLQGRIVRTLRGDFSGLKSGLTAHERSLSNGLYLFRISTDGVRTTVKKLVLK